MLDRPGCLSKLWLFDIDCYVFRGNKPLPLPVISILNYFDNYPMITQKTFFFFETTERWLS